MNHSLSRLLAPESIAVLGASDDPLKPGGRVIDYTLRSGFAGKLYPVSLNRDRVQDIRAYRRLEDVPGAPDLVVIALPEAQIAEALRSAIGKGAGAAIIFASGYAELGQHGREQQEEIAAIARAGQLRLIGPNTQGVANFGSGAIAHFGTIIDQVQARSTPIGIVSQSGAGSQIVYARLDELGLGAKYMVATGNEADVDVADLIDAYAADDEIKVILAYAESIPNPAKLAHAALRAREKGVPVLLAKAGRTQSGQRTAASHTGALASEDRVVDAFLEKYGILRVADFEELAQLSQLFLEQRGRPGRRIVSISNSGASCVLSADAAEAAGLELAPFDDAFKARLSEVLPTYIAPGNPIDMTTATLRNPALFSQILERIAQARNTDLVFAGFPIGGKGYDFDRFARELREFSDASHIPVAAGINQGWAAECFRRHRIPVFSSERRAIQALGMLANYHDRNTAPPPSPPVFAVDPAAPQAGRPLDEPASFALLARAGLPVVRHRTCDSLDAVLGAWEAWGRPPVVLKGVSAAINHKSEFGLVKVGIADDAALRAAARELLDTLARHGEARPRLMLADMAPADFEIMVGAHYDAAFGPMVAVGHGGVLVEALNDVQFMAAPVTPDEARAAIGRLHIARAFQAARGLPAVDTGALAQLLVQVGGLLADSSLGIHSLDINPVRVRRGAHAPAIVDALAVTKETRA
ncbi:acetate--CoA ligase family protein [Bordetella petrii]|uniref:acetate--CoA ligase family protein n=1 Tax=Bordetella petrii TaxID=94624 RepID=UPI001E3EEEB9|nr:acetate--CoA ligase family protein [Bordetella petrii]MCD0501684.1 acetate--CoA ligase family protein [Bordetella petrii]